MTPVLLALAAAALASPSFTHAVPLKAPVVDYPPASLKAGEAGRVGYSITITDRGKVKNCAIIASSGFRRLDEATCDLLRGTIYTPATQDGHPAGDAKTGVINWAIPTATPTVSVPPASSQQ